MAALLAVGGAWPAAAQQCVREAEKAAFDVRALQSQMMIVALTCQRHDDYNAFVQRHQPSLLGAYKEITSHFRRLHGPAAGDGERDRYVTDLANTQSQDQMRQGSSFCGNIEPLVRRAMAARSSGEIALITTTANVPVPHYPLTACGTPLPPLEAVPLLAPAARAPAAATPKGAATTRERDRREREREREGYEGDARDDEILDLRDRLEQLERQLKRQSDPNLRLVRTARPATPRAEE